MPVNASFRLFCCTRHALDDLAVFAVVVGLLCIPLARRSPTRWRRRLVVAWVVTLFVAVIRIADLPLEPLERLTEHVRSHWHALLEPNILMRTMRFENTNPDIAVPTAAEGLVLTDNDEFDMHIALDREGRFSICNHPLSAEKVRAIASHRRSRHGEFRVFIWADANASPDSRSALVRLLREVGCGSLYFVATLPGRSGSRPQYRAVPLPPNSPRGEGG